MSSNSSTFSNISTMSNTCTIVVNSSTNYCRIKIILYDIQDHKILSGRIERGSNSYDFYHDNQTQPKIYFFYGASVHLVR